jgi:hypothetical protein
MMLRRGGRRRAPGAEPEVPAVAGIRTCAADGCQVRLSRYNPTRHCSLHDGWDAEPVRRERRRRRAAHQDSRRR